MIADTIAITEKGFFKPFGTPWGKKVYCERFRAGSRVGMRIPSRKEGIRRSLFSIGNPLHRTALNHILEAL